MDKPKSSTKLAEKQGPKPLTLEDITVTWQQGQETKTVTGRQLILALEHAWSCTNEGYGDWEYCLGNLESGVLEMKAVELLLLGLSCTDDPVELAPEAFGALEAAVTHARNLVGTVFERTVREKQGRQYRVTIGKPAAAGGE